MKKIMGKRLMMFLACLFLSFGMAMAQTQVTGTVVSSEDGQPIVGAIVKVLGSKTGTVTDADGKFSLSVPADSRVTISYLGMTSKTLRGGHNMSVVLDPQNKDLDEVIVVAYGTAKKSTFTGSAGVLNSSDIAKVQVTNPVDALTGKVSGVQLNTASGQPGGGLLQNGKESTKIRIRGISSINAGNAPLIILDGAPYDGDLNNINSEDIASMTVLKDAASAALYGARGANGVIIITTKSGRSGASSFTLDAKWGANSRAIPDYEYITSPAKYYEVWASGLARYAKDKWRYNDVQANAFANEHLTDNSSYGLGYNVYTLPEGQNMIGLNGKLNPNATLGRVISYNGKQYLIKPDNWVNETFRTSLRQEYTMTASGSSDKSTFYGSANYLDNKGITANSDYKRFTSRLKSSYQVKPWLKLTGNFSYVHSDVDYLNPDDEGAVSSGNVFYLTKMAPIYPVYIRDAQGHILYDNEANIKYYDYGDGSIIGLKRPFMSMSNPLSDNLLNTENQNGNAVNAIGIAEVRLPFGFKFTSTNSVYDNEERNTQTVNPYFGQYANDNGQVYKYHYRTWSYDYQQMLDWAHQFGQHNVAATFVHEYYRTRYYELEGNKSNQFSPYNKELNGAVVLGSTESYTTDYNTEGWIGRIQYNYAEKYFGQISYRRDATSRFDPKHRWGNFWSTSGAWIISKEKWFNADWVDELKFKASYGEQGNDNIGDYRYITYYSIANSNGNVSLVPNSLGNNRISWEKQGNFNTGFDFSLFKEHLSGSVEYFNRKTFDMLAWFPLPPSYGYTGYYANIGDMSNMGVEVDVDGTLIRTKDLNWGANVNFTTYKNKITRLAETSKKMVVDGVHGYSSGNLYYGEGKSLYDFYMPKYAGVDQKTGESLFYKDVTDKTGKVTGQTTTTNFNDATQHLCGSSLPKAYGGFGTNLTWKEFDFNIDFTYSLGGKVLDNAYAEAMSGERGEAIHKDILKSWTESNNKSNVPRFEFNDSYSGAISDRFLISASYLTFQDFTVGYSLPHEVVNKLGLSKVRFYVSGNNIWTWSKRQGLDPRQSISGTNTSYNYTPIRTVSGGITVSF
jgi:TonB-linked SusC/RagA family outer membrane protein